MLTLLSRNYYRRGGGAPIPNVRLSLVYDHPSLVRIQPLLIYEATTLPRKSLRLRCTDHGGTKDWRIIPGATIYEFIMDHAQRQVVTVVVRGEGPKVCI